MKLRATVARLAPWPVRRAIKAGVRTSWTLPTARFRLLPDFLIIGAQRAGTTSLYRYLTRHPAVLPVVLTKGVHYFDAAFDKGLSWYQAHFPLSAHARLLAHRLGVRIRTGEASPYYVFHPLVAERVAEVLPDVRLILLLRDPVERAYSHYQHEVSRGFEHLPLAEALEAEEGRLAGERERMIADPAYQSFAYQHHSYVSRGMYLEQILRWHELFPRNQLLILISEEFFADPTGTMERVLAFLDLPPWHVPGFPRYNAGRYPPMEDAIRRHLERVFRRPNEDLARYLGRSLPWSS